MPVSKSCFGTAYVILSYETDGEVAVGLTVGAGRIDVRTADEEVVGVGTIVLRSRPPEAV